MRTDPSKPWQAERTLTAPTDGVLRGTASVFDATNLCEKEVRYQLRA